jgi:hypothetical protein
VALVPVMAVSLMKARRSIGRYWCVFPKSRLAAPLPPHRAGAGGAPVLSRPADSRSKGCRE